MSTDHYMQENFPLPSGGILGKETLITMIDCSRPLVENFRDLKIQLQPNGFDMTLQTVSKFVSMGKLGSDKVTTTISDIEEMPFNNAGEIHLTKGCYLLTINEIVDLPLNVMALARPRSSLLRSGVSVHTAVWDAGYRGRSQTLLTVYNPLGYSIAKNARILQMIFCYLSLPTKEGYSGRYQGENIK